MTIIPIAIPIIPIIIPAISTPTLQFSTSFKPGPQGSIPSGVIRLYPDPPASRMPAPARIFWEFFFSGENEGNMVSLPSGND